MAFFDENRRRTQQTPVKFTASNPETTVIARAHPIDRIHVALTGNLVVGTAAATLNALGGLNLIKRVSLIKDGKDVLFSLPGYLVQHVTQLYSKRAPAKTDPAVVVGTSAFDYEFIIPCNFGPGEFALLDPSDANDLVLEIQWGQASDMATAGGGGTVSVTSVQADVWTLANAGGEPGAVGGIRANYPLHLMDYREITIAQAQTDLIQDLLRNHLYSRNILFTISDGVPVNTILNSAKVSIDQSVLQTVKAKQIQRENLTNYNFSATPAGLYVFDYMDPIDGRSGKIEHLLGIQTTLPFYLTMDVAHPGAADKIIMVSDRFARPDVTQSVS